jgi:hypothetical protein
MPEKTSAVEVLVIVLVEFGGIICLPKENPLNPITLKNPTPGSGCGEAVEGRAFG